MKQTTLSSCLLLILIATFLLVGCNGDDEVDVEDLESPPEIVLLMDGEQVAPFGDVVCWPEQEHGVVETDAYDDITEICEDEAIPDFSDAAFSSLPVGSEIRLGLEEPLPDRLDLVLSYPDEIFAAEASSEFIVDGDVAVWSPDVPPGDYILLALGFWPEVGGATYYFPITIE
ncbi:MAG: hypothetical protein R3272_06760 [Candidatus Promineifilaceae bacterium]|nr:hypothetical protein [Candidatus Promineifilaceae bacterium]